MSWHVITDVAAFAGCCANTVIMVAVAACVVFLMPSVPVVAALPHTQWARKKVRQQYMWRSSKSHVVRLWCVIPAALLVRAAVIFPAAYTWYLHLLT
jgi:hypothetical protein